ncbi:MAG: helix-hairpin-helix domain-containing protein [Candidatus Eremiobacteraeota bacterium]|nr:helix-hairpin-helix domain-containing protein [Candidatus Eremiobacteraeota bacterium]
MANTLNSIFATLLVITFSFLCLRELDYYQTQQSLPPPVTVYVAGAVKRPGTVSLPSGARRIHALTAAGGLLEGNDPARLDLAKPLVDGETLLVPGLEQPIEEVPMSAQMESVSTEDIPVELSDSAGPGPRKIGLNTATAEQLQELPGVGPVLAQRIVAARNSRPTGTFATIEDLSTIRGIKRKTTARLAPYLELEAYDR